MKKNCFIRKYAVAYFLLLSISSKAIVNPLKMTGFVFSTCNSSTCYYFNGPVGHFSKTGTIFSSEKTTLVVTDKKTKTPQSFLCSELSYEHQIENISCIIENGLGLVDVNILSNRFSKLYF